MIKNNLIGFIGIFIALVGIGLAIFQDELRPATVSDPTTLSEAVFEKGAELLGVEVEKKRKTDWVTMTLYVLGFIAIVLGVFSWVKNENHRVSAAAAALGVIAVAWEYVLIGVVVAIIMLIAGSFA